MSKSTITIDGKPAEFQPGQTILDVARKSGIYTIPTLCYLKDTTATGSCRMCVVEVEGARTLLPACATAAAPGRSPGQSQSYPGGAGGHGVDGLPFQGGLRQLADQRGVRPGLADCGI